MNSAVRSRIAESADRERIVGTIAAAFAGDPGWGYLFAGDYRRLAPRFAAALLEGRVEAGTVWVTHDLAAVAMWDAPEHRASHRTAEIWQAYRRHAGPLAVRRLDAYDEAIADASPAEPFWYLGVLATDPARRREGLASAVMAPGLARADRESLPCCLETSTAENRRFYQGRGFTKSTTMLLPDGPPTWWLRRPAREGA
jgi:GNAT superfamily N-acetyltransferase